MAFGIAIAALAIGGGAQLYATHQATEAAREQNKAAKKARNIDRRVASIENQRSKRLEIARQRMEQAQIVSSATDSGTLTGSSSVAGASVGSASNTAGAIGFMNTQVAGSVAKGRALQRGADRAAVYQNRAAYAGAVGNISNSIGMKFGGVGG